MSSPFCKISHVCGFQGEIRGVHFIKWTVTASALRIATATMQATEFVMPWRVSLDNKNAQDKRTSLSLKSGPIHDQFQHKPVPWMSFNSSRRVLIMAWWSCKLPLAATTCLVGLACSVVSNYWDSLIKPVGNLWMKPI